MNIGVRQLIRCPEGSLTQTGSWSSEREGTWERLWGIKMSTVHRQREVVLVTEHFKVGDKTGPPRPKLR